MNQSKLYHCCNTCVYKNNSFYGCSKASECYNGFSAYSPNPEMKRYDAWLEAAGHENNEASYQEFLDQEDIKYNLI